MNPKVDEFLNKEKKWQEEFKKLRMFMLGCNLNEELKWGKPCYTFENNNIAIMQGFKDYCALMFFKGALLKDPNRILIRPGEHSQAQRQVRFTSVQDIAPLEDILKAYIIEAIEIEKSGLKVDLKKTEDYTIPEELKDIFNEMPEFKTAFEKLSPGRQRGYLLYFSQPKQSKTRVSRIEKYMQHIFSGKGLNDR